MNWELLMRYVNAEATAEEMAAVEAWVSEKAENKIILKQLQLKQKQLAQPVSDDVVHNEWVKVLDRVFEQTTPSQQKGKVTRLFGLLGIAATVLIACCVTWYSLRIQHDSTNNAPVIVKTIKERRQVQLPDGSVVYLAPSSNLVISSSFGGKTREVTLTGEAFFDVKHNAQKSFIVQTANNSKVNVLGTSFNVYSRRGVDEEVKVATGLVGVVNGKTTTMLKAGEQLDYALANAKINKTRVNVSDAASLQNGVLYFNNSNAAQIAQKITRYYNIKVEVAASANKHSGFSGEMKDYGLAKMLDGLHYATGIKYRFKNENSILIY